MAPEGQAAEWQDERPSPWRRGAILALLIAVYAGGVYHAWLAVHAPRAPLPHAEVEALAARLVNASAGAPPAPQLACAPHPLLSVVAAAADGSAAARLGAEAYRLLEAALSSLHPLLDLELTTSTLLCAPAAPAASLGGGSSAAALEQRQLAPWAARLRQLAWQSKQAHLPEPPAASLLWYLPPAGVPGAALRGEQRQQQQKHHRQQQQQEDGQHIALGSSMVLADDTLLLLAEGQAAAETPEPSEEPADQQQQRERRQLARAAVPWLLGMLGVESSAPQRQEAAAGELALACAADAVAVLQGFLRSAADLPGMSVPAELAAEAAGAAAGAAAALDARAAGRPWEALREGRRAWEQARQAASDPGFGTEAHFPFEHTLAVLLPLGLPATLVLAQAVLREARAWRARRRQRRTPPEQQTPGPEGTARQQWQATADQVRQQSS
eukprot:scaffold2.g7337.t1